MAVHYNIYTNAGSGGPVDYSTPVATTPDLSYVAGPLAPGTDTTFAVRAFDTATNLEEANTEARVRVVTDAGGNDVGAVPNAPHALSVAPTPGGGCRVSWAYAPDDGRGAPAGFHVYLRDSPPAGPAPPVSGGNYTAGKVGYSVTLPGPYPPDVYSVTVAAFNAAGEGEPAGPVDARLGLPATPFDMDEVEVDYI